MGEAGRDTQVTFTFREWASAKATVGRRHRASDNAFAGAHPLRSLTTATMCLLAVLRHIRSRARKQWAVHGTTLAADQAHRLI